MDSAIKEINQLNKYEILAIRTCKGCGNANRLGRLRRIYGLYLMLPISRENSLYDGGVARFLHTIIEKRRADHTDQEYDLMGLLLEEPFRGDIWECVIRRLGNRIANSKVDAWVNYDAGIRWRDLVNK